MAAWICGPFCNQHNLCWITTVYVTHLCMHSAVLLSWTSSHCTANFVTSDARTTAVLSILVTWQGGRDTLGWIRQLVTFTESQPIFTSEPRSSGVEYDPGAGFERTVFPSMNPSRREDVALLEQWMLAMMDQITAALPKHLRSDPNKVHSPFLESPISRKLHNKFCHRGSISSASGS